MRLELDKVLSRNELTPATARKLAGKLRFTVSGVFGKVGRAALKPLYARGAERLPKVLSDPLKLTILWWSLFLVNDPPPRRVPRVNRRKTLTFSDGEGSGVCAVVIWTDEGVWGTRIKVAEIIQGLFAGKTATNHINVIEVIVTCILLSLDVSL